MLAPLLLGAAATTLADAPSLVLAIPRPDGYLVPIAAYANGRWERAWPTPDDKNVEQPTFERTASFWRRHGRALPKTWHVWSGSASKPTQVRVSGIDTVDAYCGLRQIALKTDLQPIKHDQPVERRLAVDATVPVATVEDVAQSDPQRKLVERVIARRLADLESQRARATRVQVHLEAPEPIVDIKALYREPRSPRSPLYFVAEKRYRTSREPADALCNAVTIMTGWLIRADDDGFRVRAPRIFLTDCDGVQVRTAEPLAALHVSNRLFWILREHGYEDVSYVVAEIGPSEIRYAMSVYGGGC
jgi:hypothetical protein